MKAGKGIHLILVRAVQLKGQMGKRFNLRFANKIRKSQIRHFCGLQFFKLQTFSKCGNLRACNLQARYFCEICDLRT